MFTKARLKLTAWYVLIIMFVSFSFSAFIYKSVSVEFQRRLDAIEVRLQLPERGLRPPPGQAKFFIQDIEDAKEGVMLLLVYTNVVIFFFSAFSGYFLAGKTLSPIERSLEEQKRFMADASHELKTPLTALHTSIEVTLRDKKLTLRDAKETLINSLNEVKNMAKLANELLSLTRFYSGDNNLVFEKVDVYELVKNVYKKMNPSALKKKIRIELKVDKVQIDANKENIEKLVTILFDNAIKYTSKNGKIVIETKSDKKKLLLMVKDSGVGISKKDIPHIFDRFYRADPSRSTVNEPGFGLGLSLAKDIVRLHKGSIKVSSRLGKGSIFTVYLPL